VNETKFPENMRMAVSNLPEDSFSITPLNRVILIILNMWRGIVGSAINGFIIIIIIVKKYLITCDYINVGGGGGFGDE
jgi:hypothetical protein